MEFIKVIIIGIIEGVTEWLPVSSTGHMILADEFIKLNISPAFREMFFVAIQLGAICAALLLYFAKLNPIAFNNKKIYIKKEVILIWIKIIAACLPAAIIGLLWDDEINALFFNYQTTASALIIVGIIFIIVENHLKGKTAKINAPSEISYKAAFIIGLCQLVSAIFPGTSRSGAVIIGALLLGASRSCAAEFAFFLAIPVMFGASALKLFKFGFVFNNTEILMLLLGLSTAFIVSILTINFLLSFITKHNFKVFGYYCIVLGIIVLFYFAIK
jgi:undecaprenyl-diphosphatase